MGADVVGAEDVGDEVGCRVNVGTNDGVEVGAREERNGAHDGALDGANVVVVAVLGAPDGILLGTCIVMDGNDVGDAKVKLEGDAVG